MGGDTADIGDERRETVFLEGDHIGRRKVMGDDDECLFLDPLDRLHQWPAGMTEKFLDHPFDDLPDVILALAQVGIVELAELGNQTLHLLDQSPLGVAAPLANDLARLVEQFRVIEEHRVDVDERAQLGRRALGRLFHRFQFALDHLDRGFKAGNFPVDHARCDGQVRHLECRMRHEHGPPDGDAGGNAKAMQDETHALIPLRQNNRRSRSAWHPSLPARRDRRFPA